jgi:hypothetical protein
LCDLPVLAKEMPPVQKQIGCTDPRIKRGSLKASGQIHAPAALLVVSAGLKIDTVTKMFAACCIIHAPVTEVD